MLAAHIQNFRFNGCRKGLEPDVQVEQQQKNGFLNDTSRRHEMDET